MSGVSGGGQRMSIELIVALVVVGMAGTALLLMVLFYR